MVANAEVGYETILECSGAPLSGGQSKNRTGPRVFLRDPRSWYSTSQFNPGFRRRTGTTETLLRAKEERVTVVVITQRPAVLNAMDKLLVLRAGRAGGLGPPSEVLVRLVLIHPGSRARR